MKQHAATILIPEDLRKRCRFLQAERDVSFAWIVRAAIREYLDRDVARRVAATAPKKGR